jgi:hypothetical protein
MRTLEHIYNKESTQIGTGKTDGPMKLIKSPNTGEMRLVASYINDFDWKNDKNKTMVDVGRITGTNSNFNRDLLINKNVDRTHAAVPIFVPIEKNIREV